jgi:hypothetical protein
MPFAGSGTATREAALSADSLDATDLFIVKRRRCAVTPYRLPERRGILAPEGKGRSAAVLGEERGEGTFQGRRSRAEGGRRLDQGEV